MKKLLLSVLALFSTICFTANPVSADQDDPLPCDYKKIGLDAAKFYIYLTQDTPYLSWALWPGKGKLSQGKAPHGAYVTTYVNPVAQRSIDGSEEMAYGSLIVTENYDAEKKLTGLAVMLKIKGYNPQGGDWYWFQYGRQGAVVAAGRVDGCINCHQLQTGNDYLMTGPVKK